MDLKFADWGQSSTELLDGVRSKRMFTEMLGEHWQLDYQYWGNLGSLKEKRYGNSGATSDSV